MSTEICMVIVAVAAVMCAGILSSALSSTVKVYTEYKLDEFNREQNREDALIRRGLVPAKYNLTPSIVRPSRPGA